ncbi:hypothetical protein M426DRAFT_21730 [Hypoxylon sp. CI-4A]|nr:hypothetical protein M426DRAFT_21730 [Hypoxylon sp. CI-4A]
MDSQQNDKANLPPPLYDNLHAGLGNSGLPIPPPATAGKFYFDNPTKETIQLWFRLDEDAPDGESRLVRLAFKSDKVPQLMREGLHWSLDNVRWEDGFLCKIDAMKNAPSHLVKYLLDEDLTVARSYFLHDLHVPSRWVAHLQVFASSIKLLSKTRPEHLTMESIETAHAWSVDDQRIYQYNKACPEEACNAIYNDMPLEGWWPWPKKNEN